MIKKKGNMVYGKLYYNNKLILSDNKKLFTTNAKAIEHYTNVVTIEYAASNGIKSYEYLKNNNHIKIFVRKYLTDNKITYGTVLDVIEILKEEGFVSPENNASCAINDIMGYFKIIDKISLELKKQLCSFGYGADRNSNNTHDHVSTKLAIKHQRCINLVYTRYPWTPGYKANKAVERLIKSTEFNYAGNQDMTTFSKQHSALYLAMTDLLEAVHTLGVSAKNTLEDLRYVDIAERFDMLVCEDKEKLISRWQTLTPSRYGKFTD